jgi:hypothetical protein
MILPPSSALPVLILSSRACGLRGCAQYKDQIHWADVFCSISACLLIAVGFWAFRLVVRPKEYYRKKMRAPMSASTLDFHVFGGKIASELADRYSPLPFRAPAPLRRALPPMIATQVWAPRHVRLWELHS